VNERSWPSVIIGLLPERQGVAVCDTLFDIIAIAQQGYPFIRTQYARTELQRNIMAEHLLGSDFSHLLMLDADHRYRPDLVQRLVRWIKQDRERQVVAALAFRRCPPYDPCAYILKDGQVYTPDEWTPGLLKVDLAGTAAMLIDRRVFEKLKRPFFGMDFSGAEQGQYPGEDMYFCHKVRAAGLSVWVDTSTIVPHHTDGWIDQRTHESYKAMLAAGTGSPWPVTEDDLLRIA